MNQRSENFAFDTREIFQIDKVSKHLPFAVVIIRNKYVPGIQAFFNWLFVFPKPNFGPLTKGKPWSTDLINLFAHFWPGNRNLILDLAILLKSALLKKNNSQKYSFYCRFLILTEQDLHLFEGWTLILVLKKFQIFLWIP